MSAANGDMGVAAYHPATGECFGAYRAMRESEFRELMQGGAIIEALPLPLVADAFCVAHLSRRVVETGPVVARYLDADIPAWISIADGVRHEFVRVLGGARIRFKSGQLVMAPGLIFEAATQA